MSPLLILIFVGLGAVAGTLAGMLGIGGGLVIVPILAAVFAHQHLAPDAYVHVAVGTSLGTIIFTSLAAAYAHHRRGAVSWSIVRRLVPGVVIGALLGAAFAHTVETQVLGRTFGTFEILIALQMAFDKAPAPHRNLPGPVGMLSVGTAIGAVSAVLGIGGGTLTVPFLVWCNVHMRNAVAISSACGLPIAVAGTAGFVFSGWHVPALPPGSTGYVYWPALLGIVLASVLFAPLGAGIAHRLPARALKRVFALCLAVLGTKMLMS